MGIAQKILSVLVVLHLLRSPGNPRTVGQRSAPRRQVSNHSGELRVSLVARCPIDNHASRVIGWDIGKTKTNTPLMLQMIREESRQKWQQAR